MPELGDILIIGAGPAGLAAAGTLERAGCPLTLVEKRAQVGGLSRTYRFEEEGLVFLTDNGPHRFFSKNPELYAFIEGVLGESWIEVTRSTRQFIEGRFYDYPIDLPQALRNIGPRRALRMGLDYARGRMEYRPGARPILTFEDHIVAHFGRSLGELNMINYTEKIWGIPAARIHPDWARQRIQGLSLRATLRTAMARGLSLQAQSPRSLVDTFYYPDRGTGLIYETLAEQVAAAGNPVHRQTEPVRIHHDGRRILSVDLRCGDRTWTEHPQWLVESIPLPQLVKLMDPPPPPEVLEAAGSLRSRSQVYLFLTLDRPRVGPDQWVYFPDRSVPFGRISEMRNFSEHMAPPGKTSLFVEFFCWQGDATWQASREELTRTTVDRLCQMGFIEAGDLRRSYLLKARDVYPVYDLDYEGPLATIKEWLDSFDNLLYIGRPGRFRYNNQDHSLEMGMLAARGILGGTRPDFDLVGSEPDYYEAGAHPPPDGPEA